MSEQVFFDEIADAVKGYGLDIELLVDVSGSMRQGKRIDQACEFAKVASAVAAIADEDGGIGLTLFSDWPDSVQHDDVSAERLPELFSSMQVGGTTDTYYYLKAEIDQHFERKAQNPNQRTLIACITDGEPNSGQNTQIETLLTETQSKVSFADKVAELKVLFYQVGDDVAAKTFLQKLDDCDGCGKLVETVIDGDVRSPAQIFRDAIREHLTA